MRNTRFNRRLRKRRQRAEEYRGQRVRMRAMVALVGGALLFAIAMAWAFGTAVAMGAP